MNNTQFLLYLDAPSGVHQVLAFNMIYGIAPFKLQESDLIQLPNEMKGAKDAQSMILLHSGKQILCKDTFKELMDALANAEVVAIPVTAIDETTDELVLQTTLPEPTRIAVPDAPVVDVDPNKLRTH